MSWGTAVKGLEEVIRAAREQGWAVSQTGKLHIRLVPPDPTRPIVIAAGTPSDVRAVRNLISQARRSGLRWPPTEFKVRHKTKRGKK